MWHIKEDPETHRSQALIKMRGYSGWKESLLRNPSECCSSMQHMHWNPWFYLTLNMPPTPDITEQVMDSKMFGMQLEHQDKDLAVVPGWWCDKHLWENTSERTRIEWSITIFSQGNTDTLINPITSHFWYMILDTIHPYLSGAQPFLGIVSSAASGTLWIQPHSLVKGKITTASDRQQLHWVWAQSCWLEALEDI